jgi:uncharacterized protein YbjT (DUF2867 family)
VILVAGASGKVGQAVILELKQQGYAVRALVRNQAKFDAAVEEIFVADASKPQALKGACDRITTVISTIGGSLRLQRTKGKGGYWEVDYQANKNLLAEARAAQVKKIIYVSVFQAEQMQGIAYAEAHAAFEEELRQSGLDYALIRPTGIFYIFEEFLKLARKGIMPLIGSGKAQTNPIDEREVAQACVAAMTTEQKIFDLGGPDIFSRRELAELCFRTVGQTPRFIKYPVGLMRFLIAPLKFFDQRLYDFLAFGIHASTTDIIAPRIGKNHLENYLKQLTAGG